MQSIIGYLNSALAYLVDVLQLTSPYRYIVTALDIFFVVLIIVYIARIIKRTRAGKIVKGIAMIAIMYIIAKLANMVVLTFLLCL